jgi:hypothetical protein
MCVGAVAQLAAAVTMMVTGATVRAAIASQPGLTAALRNQELSLLTFREIGAVVAADAAADMIAGAAVWLIALATMVLIFTRQTGLVPRHFSMFLGRSRAGVPPMCLGAFRGGAVESAAWQMTGG